MNWMLLVFFVTTVVCASEKNISNRNIYCEAEDAFVGQTARITCFFHQDLQAGRRSVNVGHYPSFTFEEHGIDVLVCSWEHGVKDPCIAKDGYKYELSANGTVTLTIANVTKAMAGIYDCTFAEDHSSRLHCSLNVIEQHVEPSTESSRGTPSRTGFVIGLSVGGGTLIVLAAACIFLYIRHRRRRRLFTDREDNRTQKPRACSSDHIPLQHGLVDAKQSVAASVEVFSSTATSASPMLPFMDTGSNPCAEKPEEPDNAQYLTTMNDRDTHDPSDAPGELSPCGKKEAKLYGNQPENGKMTMNYSKDPLPGYEDAGSFEIRYSFPAGKQSEYHPHPGRAYKKFKTVAYLPDTREGRKVLMLLKVAFDRRLTFTIRHSKTTKLDEIIWNGIIHKTKRTGGNARYTYPDKNYLKDVQSSLGAKNVTKRDLTIEQMSFVKNPDRFEKYKSQSDFSNIFNIDV